MNYTTQTTHNPHYLDLTLVETRVLHQILAHVNKDGVGYPSLNTIAGVVFRWWTPDQRKPGSLGKAISRLEELGILRVERSRGRGNSNRYYVTCADEKGATNAPFTRKEERGRLAAEKGATLEPKRGRIRIEKGATHAPGTPTQNSKTLNSTLTPGSKSGVRSSIGCGSGEKQSVRRFRELGVRSTSLVRKMFRKKPKWMKRLLAYLEANDHFDDKAGFAVWALKHPDEVSFDSDRSGSRPRGSSTRPAVKLKCDECGGKLKAKREVGDLLMLSCPDCWNDSPVYAYQKGGKWKRKR